MENRKQKALVTGYKGFIGSNLYNFLFEKGWDVDGLDLKDSQDIRTCYLDRSKYYDVIFHLAAQASIPLSFEQPEESHNTNVGGTIRLLEYARDIGAKMVFSSSSSIYDPVSPYALQKWQAEQYLQIFWKMGVKSVALRYFNVFGEGQEYANGSESLVLAKFMGQKRRDEALTIVGTGKQRRDFVYVKDICRANLLAYKWLKKAKEFKVFDVGTGKNTSINEVAELVDPKGQRVRLTPRIEPFANKANKNRFIPSWKPTVSLENWLNKQYN